MADWSSIRELYYLYKPEIRRYGTCLFGIVIGLLAGHWQLSTCFFAAMVIMYAHERWGRPWAKRGEQVLKGRSRDNPHKHPPAS